MLKFYDRNYFKQPPHYRILAKENNKLIGQIGLDYRAMNLDGNPIKVLGIIDICVDSKHRNRGIGKTLLKKVDDLSLEFSDKVDFIFLVTNIPNYFEQYGFRRVEPITTWIKIMELGLKK